MTEEEFIRDLLEKGWDKVDAYIHWLNIQADYPNEEPADALGIRVSEAIE